MQLLFATRNQHKIEEVKTLLQGSGVNVVGLDDVGVPPGFDVAETGSTFHENAALKAIGFGQAMPSDRQTLTAADDSGLCVEALGGEPGVYSKRWIPGSDHDRNLHLLQMLDGQTNRHAYFMTVVALWDLAQGAASKPRFFEGRVEGKIGVEERGHEGFGYDPVFIPDGYDNSFGELGLEVKNTLSHRARAFLKLKDYLESGM
jgi:XTP/dITP diphosphohydrolase